MTAPSFEDFVPPAAPEGDAFKPKEHYDKPLLVKVRERKEGIITEFTPEPGGPGVIVDLVDLTDGNIYRDVLWMGGAIVDGLTPYVGKVMVIRFEAKKANTGRKYPAPIAASDADKELAGKYFTSKGDPFAPVLTDLAPADEKPPF